MSRVEEAIKEILAIVDNDTSRILCDDIRFWEKERGEADALKQAAMVKGCAEAYVRHEERLRQMRGGNTLKDLSS